MTALQTAVCRQHSLSLVEVHPVTMLAAARPSTPWHMPAIVGHIAVQVWGHLGGFTVHNLPDWHYSIYWFPIVMNSCDNKIQFQLWQYRKIPIKVLAKFTMNYDLCLSSFLALKRNYFWGAKQTDQNKGWKWAAQVAYDLQLAIFKFLSNLNWQTLDCIDLNLYSPAQSRFVTTRFSPANKASSRDVICKQSERSAFCHAQN